MSVSRCGTGARCRPIWCCPAARPAPVIVMRTPYGKSGEPQAKRAAVFARGGYAFASVDVRGRGDSDGVFEPYRNDGPDGADVIAWAAAQDWCTGDVATYGGSYGGRIQWLTALQQPPALRAMVCMVTPSDPFVECPTGLPWPMQVGWQRLTDGRVPQYTDDVDWGAVFRHRPLATMDEAAGFVSANWRAELQHPTLDDWWEPVRYQHRIGEIDLPVLHVSGWYDDEEIGTPANFAAMTAAGRRGPAAAHGRVGAPGQHHPHPGRGRLRPGRADRSRRIRHRFPRRAHPEGDAGTAARPGADLRHGRERMARRTVLATRGQPACGVPLRQRGPGQQPVRGRPAGPCPGPGRAAARRVDARPGPAGAVHHGRQLRADRRPGRLQRRARAAATCSSTPAARWTNRWRSSGRSRWSRTSRPRRRTPT